MRKSEILSRFNPNLSSKELQSVEDFIKLQKRVSRQTKSVDSIDTLIERKTNELQQRLYELDIKVNSTLFGDRKFINESYAFEIPISEQFFEPNNNVVFKDNILTTKSVAIKSKESLLLGISNIKPRKNTNFKYVNDVLTIQENEYYAYQELEINFPTDIVSGYFYIEFDTYNNISVLNKYGKELIPKQVTNKVKYPIALRDKAIVLRFNNNSKKTLKILDFYITQESFNTSSEVYSKPIDINRSISQIGLFSCDNYSSEDISLDYKISINGGTYKDIRPLNKQKNLNLNSILSTDFLIKEYKLKTAIVDKKDSYYLIEDFDYKAFNLIESFKYKLGDNVGYINTEETIYINTPKERVFIVPKNVTVVLNKVKVEGGLEGKEVVLKEGFNSLEVSIEDWKQRHNLLEVEILEVQGSAIKFKDKFGIINVINIEDSIFYQLYDLDIYSTKLDSKLTFKNDKIYITKGDEDLAYVFIKERSVLVKTIQLKIDIKTLNKNTPPYISSLTLKAV